MASKRKTDKSRAMSVVEDNALVMARYSLNVSEQRLLLFLISRIKPTDKAGTAYTVEIKDIMDTLGYSNHNYYTILKSSFKKLADTSAWLTDIDERGREYEFLFRWLNTVMIRPKDGTVTFNWHSSVEKYLMDLKENFTKFSLFHTLALKSKYAIRLYTYFQSNAYRGVTQIDIDVLKKVTDAEKYKEYVHFRQRVIEPSILDINVFTNLYVEYEPVKDGKKIVALKFTIEEKHGIQYEHSLHLTEYYVDRNDDKG